MDWPHGLQHWSGAGLADLGEAFVSRRTRGSVGGRSSSENLRSPSPPPETEHLLCPSPAVTVEGRWGRSGDLISSAHCQTHPGPPGPQLINTVIPVQSNLFTYGHESQTQGLLPLAPHPSFHPANAPHPI